MFCPKCAAQNAENVRFCRSCGIELEAVAAALSGRLSLTRNQGCNDEEMSNDPDKLWNSFVSRSLIGLAFVIIAIYLTVSGTIGGNVWGFWLLIPGATLLGRGISSYFKAKRIERKNARFLETNSTNAAIPPQNANAALPPRQTLFANEYAAPVRNTDELYAPPSSVTEGTTRHLNINTEGETFNLPNHK
jgi:hypothetical protein